MAAAIPVLWGRGADECGNHRKHAPEHDDTVDGFYLFTGLSADTYRVQVDDAALAPLFTPTACNVGSDPLLDSDCNPATVVLANHEVRERGTDFGYCPRGVGSIGDFVWHDLDFDGLQDPGEPGIQGVLVVLEDTAGNLDG